LPVRSTIEPWRRHSVALYRSFVFEVIKAMPEWTSHDRRQYEHIKDSVEDRGKSSEDAKEIAARTVNKQRRKEGRTPNDSSQGTGNPNTKLEERTVDELRNLAAEYNIDGRSRMRKDQLIEAIRNAR
jgi:hypothetical protein